MNRVPTSRLPRIATALLITVVALGAIASPAAAKHRRHRHRHPTRHLVIAPPGAQQTTSFPPGWGVIHVSGSSVRLSGSPLDSVNNVLVVSSTPGITLDLSSASMFRSSFPCGLSSPCSVSNTPSWNPIGAGALRSQDQVVVGLAVTDSVAAADASSGTPVPVSWLYDTSG